MKYHIITILAFLLLCGCSGEREKQTANSAATIHAAITAAEQGAPLPLVAPAIKSNAMAIIHAQGYQYPPGEDAPKEDHP